MMSAEDEEIIKQGWLAKRGSVVGGWKKRWMVLSSQSLSYSKTPAHPFIGRIPIPTCQTIELMTDARSKGCTFVLTSTKRGYTLRAASSNDARAWIETLQAVIGCNGSEEISPTEEVCRKTTTFLPKHSIDFRPVACPMKVN